MADTMAVRNEEAPGAMPGARLNVGCGRNVLDGWVNIDRADLAGVDIVADLEACRSSPLPVADDSVSEILVSHTLEHVSDTLGLMDELYRVAMPGALMTVRVPYGTSDDAWEDPTHLRPYFLGSWGYYSQPYYWRAQYNTTDERDLFGNRLHPNPLCPWHVRKALPQQGGEGARTFAQGQPALLGRGMRLASENEGHVQRPLSEMVEDGLDRGRTDRDQVGGGHLLAEGVRPASLREGMVQSALSTHLGSGRSGSGGDQEPQAERQGPVYEGRLLACDGPARSDADDSRASAEYGTSPRTTASSVGERAPQKRECEPERLEELGTLVHAAACRTKDRGLADLARLLVPERIAENIELGERGCVCSHADYGYRGDWQPETVTLVVPARWRGLKAATALERVRTERNVVHEMIAILRAVKPARLQRRELQVAPQVRFEVLPHA